MTQKKAPRLRFPKPRLAADRKVPKLDNLLLQLEQVMEDIKHSELTKDHKYLESQVLATVRSRVAALEDKEKIDSEDLRDKGRRVQVLEGKVHNLEVFVIRLQNMNFWQRLGRLFYGYKYKDKLVINSAAPENPAEKGQP